MLRPTCTPIFLEAGHFQARPCQGACGCWCSSCHSVFPRVNLRSPLKSLCCSTPFLEASWWSLGSWRDPSSSIQIPRFISARSFLGTWRWLVSLLILLFSYWNDLAISLGIWEKGELTCPRSMLPHWTGMPLNVLILWARDWCSFPQSRKRWTLFIRGPWLYQQGEQALVEVISYGTSGGHHAVLGAETQVLEACTVTCASPAPAPCPCLAQSWRL